MFIENIQKDTSIFILFIRYFCVLSFDICVLIVMAIAGNTFHKLFHERFKYLIVY